MALTLPTAETWAADCAADGEFQLAARHWTGGLKLVVGDDELSLKLDAGAVSAGEASEGVIELGGPVEVWDRFFAATPPRFHNDFMANLATGSGLGRAGRRHHHGGFGGRHDQ